MRGRLGGAIAVAATLGLAAPAIAGTTIDTTGFSGNGAQNVTLFDQIFNDKEGSEVGQSFVAPAGATKLTQLTARLGVQGPESASPPFPPAPQTIRMSLFESGPGGPGNELQHTSVVAPIGTGLRQYPVDWPVAGGTAYAVVLGVEDADVTAALQWYMPTGFNNAKAYADGQIWGRNFEENPSWVPNADGADLTFRLDFDGGATGGGGGGGGGTTTPPTTTPAAATPTPAPAAVTPAPALPAGKRALKAAKGKTGLPASVSCTSGTCTVALTAPKGARSAKVRVLRGKTLAGTASATFPSSRKATKRKLTVKPKVPVAGSYTVELTVVTASGRKVVVSAVLRA